MIKYTKTLRNPYYFIADDILFKISENQDTDGCGQHLVTYQQNVDKNGEKVFTTVRNGRYYFDEHHNKIKNDSGGDVIVPSYGDKLNDEECKKIFPYFEVGYYYMEGNNIRYEDNVTYYIQDLIAVGDRFINGTFVRNNIHNNDDSDTTEDESKYYHWNGETYVELFFTKKEELPNEESDEYIKVNNDFFHWNETTYDLIEFNDFETLPDTNEGEYIRVTNNDNSLTPDMEGLIDNEEEKDTPYIVEFTNSILKDIEKYVKSGYSFDKVKNAAPYWFLESNYGKEYTVNGKKMILFYVSNNIKQLSDNDLMDNIYETINKMVVDYADKLLKPYDLRMKRNISGNVTMVSADLVE